MHDARRPTLPLGLLTLTMLATLRPAQVEARPQDRLDAGEVVVRTRAVRGSDIGGIVFQAVIDAPPSKVWRIIEDCDAYESTFDRVSEARLLSHRGGRWTCEVTLDMPFPIGSLRAVTSSRHTRRGDTYERRWRLLEGDYLHNDGSWTVAPFGGARQRTLVTYDAHVVPDISLPDWIIRKARRRAPATIIARLRREVHALRD